MADVFVGPAFALLLGEIKMRVAAGNYQGQHRENDRMVALLPLFEQHRMNMAFQVIDGDQRLVESEGKCFRIAETDK